MWLDNLDAELKREPARARRILAGHVDLEPARSTIQGGDRSMIRGASHPDNLFTLGKE